VGMCKTLRFGLTTYAAFTSPNDRLPKSGGRRNQRKSVRGCPRDERVCNRRGSNFSDVHDIKRRMLTTSLEVCSVHCHWVQGPRALLFELISQQQVPLWLRVRPDFDEINPKRNFRSIGTG
jgi:hypothetical protein